MCVKRSETEYGVKNVQVVPPATGGLPNNGNDILVAAANFITDICRNSKCLSREEVSLWLQDLIKFGGNSFEPLARANPFVHSSTILILTTPFFEKIWIPKLEGLI